MIARFFIFRPILAWVLAISIMLFGALSLRWLPVSQYPNIAPPMILVDALYPGASADVVENSVTQILEQELKGLDNLLYFDAESSSDGRVQITLVFAIGTNPEVAQIQVQNKVNQLSYRLPTRVQQNGLNVLSQQNSFLMVAVFHDASGHLSDNAIADWLTSSMEDPISRVPGVGAVRNFGSPHAMRIWLDPHKLASYGLIPQDVVDAVDEQNAEVPVGELGARPSPEGQQLNVTVTAMSRLRSAKQFENIVLKTQIHGAVVRLSDVARVELGSENYHSTSRLNGKPASGLALMMSPGANALATASAVKTRIEQLRPSFPAGVDVFYPEDASRFVKRSIEDVVRTLLEAIGLVLLVMFLFLQNWRVTLIPAITLPVVLLGTLGVLALAGYSINTLTLFAMVLSIGLLVDDAIVVVENVERIMVEDGLCAREATLQSMGEITSVLVGIALVLGAVFLPMTFFPGSVGVIYRQFSVTMVAAMGLSVLVALTLTPALCASLLQHHSSPPKKGLAASFNRVFSRFQVRYSGALTGFLRRPLRVSVIYLLVVAVVWMGYRGLPTAFIPEDDQGTVMVRFMLPQGASYTRTQALASTVENYFLNNEAANVAAVYSVSGFSFAGSGQNAGIAFVPLRDWSQREGNDNSAQAIAARANTAFEGLMEGRVFAMVLPPIDGLGETNGFEFWLQDIGGQGRDKLAAAARELARALSSEADIMFAESSASDLSPTLHITIDQEKASAMGLALNDVNNTLSTAWGGRYINDFIYRGQIRKVMVQADAEFRSAPENIHDWQVRSRSGAMIPFSAIATSHWETSATQLARFNGLPAIPVTGAAAPGASSGRIMQRIEQLATHIPGTTYEWSGLSYQDRISSGYSGLLYGVSILFIFLCLAALYESWSIPFSVLLVIPLGVLGAVTLVSLTGKSNDIFFQIGVLTSIGLAAKNAILIVEFAETAVAAKVPPWNAITHAAAQRLRPILMTSLAFGAGVIPLVLASGPGAEAQQAIGLSVLGGVISGTSLALFYVPLSYLLICRLREYRGFTRQRKAVRV